MSIIPPIFFTRRNHLYNPYFHDVWDPSSEDDDFETAFTIPYNPSQGRFRNSYANSQVEWKDTPDAHVCKLNLPNFKKEHVKVNVENGYILNITAEKKMEKEERHDNGYNMQTRTSVFVNRSTLPENVRADQLKSSMENGVLTVIVPKKEVDRHHFRTIEVN